MTETGDLGRAWPCIDWLARSWLPGLLDLAQLGPLADQLRALPIIVNPDRLADAAPALKRARDAAVAAHPGPIGPLGPDRKPAGPTQVFRPGEDWAAALGSVTETMHRSGHDEAWRTIRQAAQGAEWFTEWHFAHAVMKEAAWCAIWAAWCSDAGYDPGRGEPARPDLVRKALGAGEDQPITVRSNGRSGN